MNNEICKYFLTVTATWIVVNIDETLKHGIEMVEYGGLLRDENGEWVEGFMKLVILFM